jgi:CheY-like chemotaxis protein
MSDLLHALLIEDSPDDVLLMQQLIEVCGVPVTLEVISDGQSALDYLAQKLLEAPESKVADFILLDLSLPRVSGIDVLTRIKEDPRLQDIPVIILSGTENDEDIRRGQELRAHTHIVKPMSATEISWIAKSIQAYWPRIDRLRAFSSL